MPPKAAMIASAGASAAPAGGVCWGPFLPAPPLLSPPCLSPPCLSPPCLSPCLSDVVIVPCRKASHCLFAGLADGRTPLCTPLRRTLQRKSAPEDRKSTRLNSSH